MSVVARKGVKELPVFIPAKSKQAQEAEIGKREIIKLAANENRYGCSKKVAPAIAAEAENFYLYPDVGSPELREAVAKYHNIAPEKILFGNGLFEVTQLIAQAYLNEGDEVITPATTFGWYSVASLQMNGTVKKVPLKEYAIDLNALFEAITEKTKIIWLCNPNNPTGLLIPEKELAEFIERVPENILVVIDEAYLDYSDRNYKSFSGYLDEYKNLVILKTFSKLYGLASLRIGYALADALVIESITKVKQPLNVNFVAQIAAKVSIEDEAFRDFVYESNKAELNRYYEFFEKNNLEYLHSEASFVLFRVNSDSQALVDEIGKQGIMIREGSRFGLGNGWIRISVGTPEDNTALLNALEKYLKK